MFLGWFSPQLIQLPVGELISCEERGCGWDQLLELLKHWERDLLELQLRATADLSIRQAHRSSWWREGGGGEER